MGYYIRTNGTRGKAQEIIDKHGAERITLNEARAAVQKGRGVICVVDNGPFEAAGFMFSPQEFEVFAQNDGRPKEWLLMDRRKAEELSGFNR